MCTICEEEFEIFTQLATRHKTWRMPDDYTEEELADHKSMFKLNDAWLEASTIFSDENHRANAASLLRDVRKQALRMCDTRAPFYLRIDALAENLRYWFHLFDSNRKGDQLSRLVARYLTSVVSRNRELLDSTFESAYPLLA